MKRQFALHAKWVTKREHCGITPSGQCQRLRSFNRPVYMKQLQEPQPGSQLGAKLTLSKHQATVWFSNFSGYRNHGTTSLNHLRLGHQCFWFQSWLNPLVSDLWWRMCFSNKLPGEYWYSWSVHHTWSSNWTGSSGITSELITNA